MNCPRCGSPVIVYKDGWECGWCLDSGLFSSSAGPGRISLRILCHVDLAEAWIELKKAFRALIPRHAGALEPSLAHAAAHRLSLSPPPEDGRVEPLFLRDLRSFLNTEKELGITAEDAERIRRGEPLFEDEAALSQERFGLFWRSLLDALEAEKKSPWETDTDDFFRTLALFGSWRRGGPGNDPDYLDSCHALQNAFHERWQMHHQEEQT